MLARRAIVPDVKRSRRERRDGWAAGCFRLNPKRDPLICYALGRCKVLPTRDIALLFFGSRETARDRLRKLHCAGLVRAHLRALDRDNVYTLTDSGRRLAVEHLDVDPDQLVVVRRLPRQLDHLLAINRVRTVLTVASQRHPVSPLRAFVPDFELAAARYAGQLRLVPDAIIKLKDAQGRRRFVALEVDLGSENPSVVGSKLLLYDQYLLGGGTRTLYGAPIEAVLLVARGLRRLRSLARVAVAVGVRFPVRLGELDAMTPGDAWSAYGDPTAIANSSRDLVRGLLRQPFLP